MYKPYLILLTLNFTKSYILKSRPMGQIKVMGPGHSIWTSSLESCLKFCDTSAECDAINYHSSTNKCRIFARCANVHPISTDSSDYYFYSKRPPVLESGYTFDKDMDTCIKLMETNTDMSLGDRICTEDNARLLSISARSTHDLAVKLMVTAKHRPRFAWTGFQSSLGSNYFPWNTEQSSPKEPNICSVLEINGEWQKVPCNHGNHMTFCEIPAFYNLIKHQHGYYYPSDQSYPTWTSFSNRPMYPSYPNNEGLLPPPQPPTAPPTYIYLTSTPPTYYSKPPDIYFTAPQTTQVPIISADDLFPPNVPTTLTPPNKQSSPPLNTYSPPIFYTPSFKAYSPPTNSYIPPTPITPPTIGGNNFVFHPTPPPSSPNIPIQTHPKITYIYPNIYQNIPPINFYLENKPNQIPPGYTPNFISFIPNNQRPYLYEGIDGYKNFFIGNIKPYLVPTTPNQNVFTTSISNYPDDYQRKIPLETTVTTYPIYPTPSYTGNTYPTIAPSTPNPNIFTTSISNYPGYEVKIPLETTVTTYPSYFGNTYPTVPFSKTYSTQPIIIFQNPNYNNGNSGQNPSTTSIYKGYMPIGTHPNYIPYRPCQNTNEKVPFRGKTYIVKGDQAFEIPTEGIYNNYWTQFKNNFKLGNNVLERSAEGNNNNYTIQYNNNMRKTNENISAVNVDNKSNGEIKRKSKIIIIDQPKNMKDMETVNKQQAEEIDENREKVIHGSTISNNINENGIIKLKTNPQAIIEIERGKQNENNIPQDSNVKRQFIRTN